MGRVGDDDVAIAVKGEVLDITGLSLAVSFRAKRHDMFEHCLGVGDGGG